MSGAKPVVWVVGAAGMLGQAVARCLETAGVAWVGSDREVDITCRQGLLDFATVRGVTHVVNCAAYTDVDGCESEQRLAERVNGHGPASLAAVACQVGAVALHVSTDYVFDGTASRPYDEEAPVRPVSAYGRSKQQGDDGFVGQMAAQSRQPWYLVRTSWLFGHGGKSFVRTMLRLMQEREQLRVVDDQHGRPTYAADLGQAIVDLIGLPTAATRSGPPAPSGIYHFANAGATTWFGFANAIRTVALEHGWSLRCKTVRAIGTAEYPTPARRPPYSVLSTAKIERTLGRAPRPWQAALAAYVVAETQGRGG
jgi:dTDP-4-dehydrorhamnose reductase